METYEAWAEDGGLTVSTVEGIVKQRTAGQLSAEARLLYRFDAATWEEAMAIHHLRQGWEPYKAGKAAHCPTCDSYFYPEGSGLCWSCGYKC